MLDFDKFDSFLEMKVLSCPLVNLVHLCDHACDIMQEDAGKYECTLHERVTSCVYSTAILEYS